MILAKNNIIVKIKNSTDYALFNPLSGSFDMMDEHEHDMLTKVGSDTPTDQDFSDYLLERGYIYHSAEDEQKAYQKAYGEFKNEIADTQVQLMLIPTYGCNLSCVYCYQHGVNAEHKIITHETVDAFFDYARKNFSNNAKKPFITLFGGEPLINSPAQRLIIDYIVDKCVTEGYELAAVTNGYDFVDYVDILKKAKIKEIQFTLDGSRAVHDVRRATANGKGTFDKVITGIDAAIKNGFPVNLRTVVDLENIEDLVHLAEYLDSKGWLDLPPERFKTQIGRNYELFSCYAKPQHLMTQTELWAEYSLLSKRYPILSKFHRPNFYVVRHIVDTGELFIASFDTCPAAKTEWVFDLNGEVYGCTASCGREEYLLGHYYPEVKLNDTAISSWQKRDVQSIEKCRDCKFDVICGGGCGVVAANKNCGNALTPDCRPVQELVEIGIHHYIDDIRKLTEESESADKSAASTAAPIQTEVACCCGDSKAEGCVVCGKSLIYADNAVSEKCFICGETFETYNKCQDGHYICDACHRADILTIAERYLAASCETNPVNLAKQVFDLPGLKMHGPEYHSIVPAILVAAYQNVTGTQNPGKIAEAIKRGKDVKGGSCGYIGGCGAAIGTGIAASIIEKATPMTGIERSNSMKASGNALLAVSKHVGPRCCKREAMTSIQSFVKDSGYFKGIGGTKYTCRQFRLNKDCIGSKCPYYPKVKITAKGNDRHE